MAANKSFQISARFTEEERNKLIEYCEANDMPVAQVIRKAVREYLENHKEEN
jgi:acylphosphatase